jgi:hypothetical protein
VDTALLGPAAAPAMCSIGGPWLAARAGAGERQKVLGRSGARL